MVPFSPGTTKCFSNPKAWQSHSSAAGAFRYRIAGIMVDGPSLGVVIDNFFLIRVDGWDTLRGHQPPVLKKCFPDGSRQMLARRASAEAWRGFDNLWKDRQTGNP